MKDFALPVILLALTALFLGLALLGSAMNHGNDPTLNDICGSPVRYTGAYVAICQDRKERQP